jgi:photosystem II stability/assembly factor-like uncharacterized protein
LQTRLIFCGLCLLMLGAAKTATAQWTLQHSGLDTNLRGVSVAPAGPAKGTATIWASGSNGVILRSADGGKTWKQLHVANAGALDFRGIVAISDKIAYAMSSGEGEKSTIYKTVDGGETWSLQYTDRHKEFFLDALVCVTEKGCYSLGDPVDGKFVLLATLDGEHWERLPYGSMPAALPSEGAFAASNSSLVVSATGEIFFGTGGPTARVFHSTNRGRTWSARETPVAGANASSGIFAIARGSAKNLVIAGGDYQNPGNPLGTAAYSRDGGVTWQVAAKLALGYRSSVRALDTTTYIAVGPTGSDISHDGGMHWVPLDSTALNGMAVSNSGAAWAVGPKGTIYSLRASQHSQAK